MSLTSGQLEILRRKQMKIIVIEDYSVCHHCKTKGLRVEDKYCPNCRFPQRGTQEEMQAFLNYVRRKKSLLTEKTGAVKKARNVLFILGALNLLVGIIAAAVDNENKNIYLFTGLIVATIYFALGIWSRKNPFAAILSGFIVFIVSMVINAIGDPNTIYQGLLWKIIIIVAFVYGYKGARESEKIAAELKQMKEAKDFTTENDLSEMQSGEL